jgi:signal transduction histidine kinase
MNTVDLVTANLPLTADLADRPGPRPAGRPELVLRTWFRGWAAIGQLLADLTLAIPYLMLTITMLVSVVLLPVALTGLPLLALVQLTGALLARLERARLLAVLGVWLPAPAAPPPPADSRRRPWSIIWRRIVLDPRRWREQLYFFTIGVWGLLAGTAISILASIGLAAATVPLYAFALPDGRLRVPWGSRIGGWWLLLVFGIGVLALAIAPLLARGLVLLDVLLVDRLIGPRSVGRTEEVAQLSQRVQTLTETREATVDSVEAERRRIERDLHDGPQQRLVAIAMDLGMAQQRIDRDPAGARELLDKAHSAAKAAVTEMRQVARNIHPPVLTDRGLNAALSALAAGAPVPVTVSVELPSRPSPTVEAIAYFCVSEALTNVAKHARATAAEVRIDWIGAASVSGPVSVPGPVPGSIEDAESSETASQVRITVSDNGIGGAGPDHGGTGLTGLADRVQAIDGTLAVDSPPGGPTVLTIHLPVNLAERS